MTTTAIDATRLRNVFAAYPSGVTAVSALVDGEPFGLAASSFTSVSLDPPLVSVCFAHSSTTWPIIRDAGRIGLSVLSAHQESVSRALSAKGTDKFADLSWRLTPNGAVVIRGAAAWFDTELEQLIRAGDHDIALFRIHDLDVNSCVEPLVFHGSTFRTLS